MELEPFPAPSFSDNYLSPNPGYLSERINPQLGTDRRGLKDVSVGIADAAPETQKKPSATVRAPDPDLAPAPSTVLSEPDPATSEFIKVSELSDYLQSDVTVTLHDDQVTNGRIQAVEGDKLKLKLSMDGGSMAIPVSPNRIASVQRRQPSVAATLMNLD